MALIPIRGNSIVALIRFVDSQPPLLVMNRFSFVSFTPFPPRLGSCFHRMVTESYDGAYRQTLGAEMLTKQVKNSDGHNSASLSVWTFGGAARYRALVQAFYPGTAAVVLVYDVTAPETMADLAFWRAELVRAMPEAALFLVGTKHDLLDDIRVTEEDGNRQAKAWKAIHLTVSSKTGDGCEDLMTRLLKRTLGNS